MKVKWGFDCGYVLNIPDEVIDIPDDVLEGLSAQGQDTIISEYVQDAFDQQVSYYWERV